jgi:AcrR family transcriptional regulator
LSEANGRANFSRVSKGETTRQAILDHAMDLARRVGLEGLSIGRLARDLGMSKSGLFAHFQSKEALQIQVLEAASTRFVEGVVRPGLARPRGEPRLRALFEGWLEWTELNSRPGGCLFVAAAVELDDRPGPARDRLVQLQKDWLDVLATTVRTGITEGQFRAEVDAEQFAHDMYGVALAYHHAAWLLRDGKARERARAAFEALLKAARRSSRAA